MTSQNSFSNGIKFIKQITSFEINEDYQELIAWSRKPYKAYTHALSLYLYFHDEKHNKLFAFETSGINILEIQKAEDLTRVYEKFILPRIAVADD